MANKFFIRHGRDLVTYLEQITNGDFVKDDIAYLLGQARGVYKGEKIIFSFSPCKFLVISSKSKIINELIPILNTVMGGVEHLCSYDMLYDNGDSFPTIEWLTSNTRNRLCDIVNNRIHNEAMCINIKLNNDSIDKYIESEDEFQERISKAKVYGRYPGSIIPKDRLDSLEEYDLFLTIENLGGKMCLANETNKDLAEKLDFSELDFTLQYCVRLTSKFGTDVSEPKYNSSIKVGPKYVAWYEKWAEFYNMQTFSERNKRMVETIENFFSGAEDPTYKNQAIAIATALHGNDNKEEEEKIVKTKVLN